MTAWVSVLLSQCRALGRYDNVGKCLIVSV